MNIALIDLPLQRSKLFPFTYTRPIGDLRVGILTIREKWEQMLDHPIGWMADVALHPKYPITTTYHLIINGAVCPNKKLIELVQHLDDGEALYCDTTLIAAQGRFEKMEDVSSFDSYTEVQCRAPYTLISRAWDMFTHNSEQIAMDYALVTKGRTSQPITDPHTVVYGAGDIFIEAGVNIKAAVLNTENGPIYLGKHSTIQEGSLIRGPFALGANSTINMGAKIREGVSIGPHCKVGGEVGHTILYANSNKGHDGYLGHAIIGEWCNLGADTNNSNLKNNYDTVQAWDFETGAFISTGLQFCGLLMGDHSKSAINTMFNTGTTIGVACNVFGSGFPRTIIHSFSWGGARSRSITHTLDKTIATARIVMQRRGVAFTSADAAILKIIFDQAITRDT